MFLSAYYFDGDPTDLVAAHDRLLSMLPADGLDLHICVVTDLGITVFDACPSREVFEGFSRSPEFLSVVSEAGLPQPRLDPLGEIHEVAGRPEAAS